MTNLRNRFVMIAAGGSAALLFGAMVVFQRIMDLPPCAMCIWQRWPHAAAILIGVLAFFITGSLLPLLGMLAALTTAGIGIYHTGVERDWWEGPASCTGAGAGVGGMDGASLLAVDSGPKLVMCDQVSWEMFTLSMPTWNAIFSLILAYFWLRAYREGKRG